MNEIRADVMRIVPTRELSTADDPVVRACTMGGLVEHDYRAFQAKPEFPGARPRTYWRCVWCHAVSCGDWGERDPCIEPYHHRVPHRSRAGVVWPIGGNRP